MARAPSLPPPLLGHMFLLRADRPSPQMGGLAKLSAEVVRLIAWHLDSEKDIYSFALISRTFYHWIVDLLYKLNSSLNEGSALLWACRKGQQSTAQLSLTYSFQSKGEAVRRKSSRSALLLACENGHVKLVELLFQKRSADFTVETPSTASLLTAGNGHRNSTQALLQNRADIDFTDINGDTPLMKAASKGHENVAKILLCKGANPNFRNEWGGTALLTAAVFGHVGLLHLLLEKGVELNHMVSGGTALHWAAAKGHKDIVIVLLQKGARADLVDELGDTAIDRAKYRGHLEVANNPFPVAAPFHPRFLDIVAAAFHGSPGLADRMVLFFDSVSVWLRYVVVNALQFKSGIRQ
ncbi:ankyrin repeat protein [Histoplasma capsulatum G186AR]|uniref:Ankyrin repeat protein n=1 Tax=Ajellomyces capsulatus (strain G186AR / H82 / ATCC MYA-2454 / RMSCC 2432) TaxID=447093 RepID=C0NR96_AJECG|nr:ankyrin repeat protein [Histoplasma capsulatum G186AR]EEH06210.1 ankyrin repeat protein [Histoplasma capsulatum G186AR]